jgi:mycothiol system anti-sigma-R factor
LPAANCAEVLSHLWEYLDDELGPETVEPIRQHIGTCAGCWLAYSVDRALLRRVAALEAAALTAPEPLVRRVSLLVRNA